MTCALVSSFCLALVATSTALAETPPGPPPHEAALPPLAAWNGATRSLVVAADHPWVTPFEASGLRRTPSYDETVHWLRKLADATPEISMESLGTSPEGREIWLAIASLSPEHSAEALRASGKPILFAQAGIHSGEIDGKDAGMMLLRDMTVAGTKRHLLDGAHFLFVPILSVDGHERSSPFGRINQRGPAEMGWRTNARNLNLNRDYTKADTPEMRALLRALARWSPDLYFDIHVTDGADYQYDITFGGNGTSGYSPAIGQWLDETLFPALSRDLRARGHVPGPLVFPVDPRDMTRGIVQWVASPRYSNGYGDARHLPAVLVENHSLKPFDQRVLGTYVLLESALATLAKDAPSSRRAASIDRARRPEDLTLSWKRSEKEPEELDFLGVASRLEDSEISGGAHVVWTGEPITVRVPRIRYDQPDVTAARAKAYWVPAAWPDVIERLALHGIRFETLGAARELEVGMYRIEDASLADAPFEGRVTVSGTPRLEKRRHTYAAGSIRVPTDQPLGDLAALLLEPASVDSFWQWGFFLEVLQHTEYVEDYVMEPLAKSMIARDPKLRAAFQKQLAADREFASDPRERLDWFYRRTEYFDDRWRLYPVGREQGPAQE